MLRYRKSSSTRTAQSSESSRRWSGCASISSSPGPSFRHE
uniref:Uncharacterized protein n=1 Tax=Arundo donax TaxID=35708 RepID=A0A0A9CKN2_ARUDO